LLTLFVLGVADIAQGRGTGHKRQKESGAAVAGTSQPLKKKQKRAESNPVLVLRERIRTSGLTSGSYVQIANHQNEKWFMRIVDGHVIDPDGDDPSLKSALWCEPNCVTRLSKTHTKHEPCEIRSIIDAGSLGKFEKMLANTKSSRQ